MSNSPLAPAPTRSQGRSSAWIGGSWSWTPGAARLVVYALVAAQVWQATRNGLTVLDFQKSYWLFTYDHGFVRRGLGGTVLQAVAPLSDRSTTAASWAVVAVAVVAVLALIEVLLRHRRAAALALAVLLAASPFTVEYAVEHRRLDVVAIALLVALGFSLRAPRRLALPLSAGCGGLLALAILAHEAIALYALPWAAVLVVVAGPSATDPTSPTAGRRTTALLVAVVAPSALALVAVAISVQHTDASVGAALLADVPWFSARDPHSEFVYFGDTIGESIRIVADRPLEPKLLSLVLGLELVVLQAAWMAGWSGERSLARLVGVRPRWLGAAPAVALAGGTVVLFASGADWLRWFSALGSGWLVVSAFAWLAAAGPPDPHSPRRVSVPKLLPFAGAFLVALPTSWVLADDPGSRLTIRVLAVVLVVVALVAVGRRLRRPPSSTGSARRVGSPVVTRRSR